MQLLYSVLAVFSAVNLAVWVILGRKVRRAIHWGARVAFHAFFVIQIAFLAGILRVALTHAAHHSILLSKPFLIVGYIWNLLLGPLFLIVALVCLTGESAVAAFRWLRPKPLAPADPPSPGAVSRREFIGTVAALAPPLLTASLSAYAETQIGAFRVRRITVTLPNLPEPLDGMTIAHLSDLHVGQFSSPEMLRAVAEATNALNADLVVFTGDLINHDMRYLPQAIEMLQSLRPEVVLCEGNHDQGNPSLSFRNQVKASGLCLLVNETATHIIRGIPVQLLGLRWDGPSNWQKHLQEEPLAKSMEQLLRQLDPEAYPILLAHHPHAWDYSQGIALTLSGHTHGGQLMLNEHRGFGPAMFRYWTGLYTRPALQNNPAKALVVSNGVGNWFPLRANAPAELLHLTLRRV